MSERLGRAREHLREVPPISTRFHQALQSRLASVHVVLYLLFNEGYLSAQVGSDYPSRVVRRSHSADDAAGRTPGRRKSRNLCVSLRSWIFTVPGWPGGRRDGRLVAARRARPVSVGPGPDASGCAVAAEGGSAERPSRAFMRKPASRPSMPLRPHSRKPAGKKSPTSTPCSIASPRRR